MFCDNCGKSNAKGVSKCAYCGSDMPKVSDSGGFSDILTFKGPEIPASYDSAPVVNDSVERVSEIDMKRLIDKSDEIFKNTKFSLIAICASILISVIALVSVILMKSSVTELQEDYVKKEDLTKELSSLKTSIAEIPDYSTTLNDILAKLDKEGDEPEEDDEKVLPELSIDKDSENKPFSEIEKAVKKLNDDNI